MRIIMFAMTFMLALNSYAWKNVSGGNGVGGTLKDVSVPGSWETLDSQELESIFTSQFSKTLGDFPYLINTARHYFRAKAWYLDDRPLADECLNKTLLNEKTQIWACQNDVEVRIHRADWNNINNQNRAALLLHEVLTAMRGDTDDQFDHVPPAVREFLDANASSLEKQLAVYRLGFPSFPTTTQMAYSKALYVSYLPKLCPGDVAEKVEMKIMDDVTDLGALMGLTELVMYSGIYSQSSCSIAMKPALADTMLWQGFWRGMNLGSDDSREDSSLP